MGGLSRPHGHGQVRRKGLSPTFSLNGPVSGLIPLTNDLAELQLPPLRLCACRRCFCPQIDIEQPKVRHLGAPSGEALDSLGKRGPQGPQRTLDVGLAADER